MINRVFLPTVEAFIVPFNTISRKLLFGNYNSMD